jgi:hypothetical protein
MPSEALGADGQRCEFTLAGICEVEQRLEISNSAGRTKGRSY